ncbi:MAG: hypothetical protein JRI68_29460 [Deltaproteobacteria bacterium]|nr:hypothetical protein [Deltaproteobacteria bacterium]
MHTLPPIFGSLALLAVLGIAVTLVLRRLRLPPAEDSRYKPAPTLTLRANPLTPRGRRDSGWSSTT